MHIYKQLTLRYMSPLDSRYRSTTTQSFSISQVGSLRTLHLAALKVTPAPCSVSRSVVLPVANKVIIKMEPKKAYKMPKKGM